MKPLFLLANLGSPLSPKMWDVRRYLREFLTDPYVIDIPSPLRELLVNGIIVPFRSKYTAEAYQYIWEEDGSPLINWTYRLAEEMRRYISDDVHVIMRYGEPNINQVTALAYESDRVYLLGLYPQHADSTRTTLIEKLKSVCTDKRIWVLQPFYNEERYRSILRDHLAAHLPDNLDHLIFSFHGIPLGQIKKADTSRAHCLKSSDCCEVPHPCQSTCYRHQCLVNSSDLADVFDGPSTTSFQSRVGRMAWLQPYTENVLTELAQQGVKNAAIFCPSFVSDNLETIYDVGVKNRELWHSLGGESLTLIPSLNCNLEWAKLLVEWCKEPDGMFKQVA